MFRVICAGLFAAAVAVLAGCEKKAEPTKFEGKHDHDHGDHDRKDALLVDTDLPDGTKCHAGLQAHLGATDGSELDVFFETLDKQPKPVPIPLKSKVTARVTRKGDDTVHNLVFEPAEKDERKGDPDDKCSRYAADAKWMKPDDELTVVLTVEMDGKVKRTTFDKFVPRDRQH